MTTDATPSAWPIVKAVGGLIIVKMFIAIFTNKLSKSLTKRYVD